MPRSKYSAGLEGMRFNRTVILSFSHRVKETNNYRYYWYCSCDCGTQHIADARSMFRGMVQSCGCLNRDPASKFVKHGHSRRGTRSREFTSWLKMKGRCYDPRNEWFHRYGGRGIQVCELFRNDFSAFLSVVGFRPPRKTIDRINNDGHYSCGSCSQCVVNRWPMNVRWATIDEQNGNKSTSTVIEFNGKRQALFLWAKEIGICQSSLRKRLRKWPLEKALTLPRTI